MQVAIAAVSSHPENSILQCYFPFSRSYILFYLIFSEVSWALEGWNLQIPVAQAGFKLNMLPTIILSLWFSCHYLKIAEIKDLYHMPILKSAEIWI